MKRFIDVKLEEWRGRSYRKPLLLRGARQVGKTHSVRQLGRQFTSFVEVNLEVQSEIRAIFEKNLDPARILRELELKLTVNIVPGQTLLFIDEVQSVPRAVTALRYFYEHIPALHVIAAGSLLDFAIQQVGVPVGRVEFMHLYPMSFLEYLLATKADVIVQEICTHPVTEPMSGGIHEHLLTLLSEYIAIGGMPGVVACWAETKDARRCFELQHSLVKGYRSDFVKYASKFQIKYVERLFKSVPQQLGGVFKYSHVDGEYRKRELAPSLELLVTAGVVHEVLRCSGQGVPIGAYADPDTYKMIGLDIAVCQTILGFDLAQWFLNPFPQFINKGELMEAFVGQELLAYANPYDDDQLYYWQRNAPGSSAEVDYLVQSNSTIIPIEVKGGSGKTLKSLHMFLESHPHSPYGIRFSTQNYSVHEKVHSYPLYAVAKVACDKNPELKQAIAKLTEGK